MSQPKPARLAATPTYLHRVKKLTADEQRALARALRLFVANPSDGRLRVHKLQGKLQGRLAFSFGYDARVVFSWDEHGEERIAVLLDVGSHDEVYG